MRLHHLEVVAFGPFADPVSIDFDALSDAGLFLLSGPTGAGKSSVLDAVCFALYGDVPGDRAIAKRLRSDHAAPDVAPRVVLEVTLSGRRFRIDRSPAWVRPKKRGTGTTSEQARVVISEHRPTTGDDADPDQDAWLPLSTRLDETGHLVTRLVGMTLPQQLDQKHQQTHDRLAKLRGAEFDRAYMRDMVADHDKDVKEFRQQAQTASDPDIKAFAQQTLPTIEEHDKMAHDTVKSLTAVGSSQPPRR